MRRAIDFLEWLTPWAFLFACVYFVIATHHTDARQDRNIDKILTAATQAGWTVEVHE